MLKGGLPGTMTMYGPFSSTLATIAGVLVGGGFPVSTIRAAGGTLSPAPVGRPRIEPDGLDEEQINRIGCAGHRA